MNSTPPGVMTAISSSPRKTTSRVWLRIGGDVGGDEELVVAEPDDDRRTVADGHDLVRIVGRDQHEREQAAQVEQRAAATAFSQARRLFISRSTRWATISVSVSVTKRVPFFLELPLQIEVVLDDAVVHHDDVAGAVAMRVRVLLGRTAVRRPSCMADAVLAAVQSSGFVLRASSRRESLPALRRSSIVPSRTTATPAES